MSKTSVSDKHFETRAIHAGQQPDPTTGAIMTPIYQTSTYVQESPGRFKHYEYSRTDNPTRHAMEENLASLEEAPYGVSFSSGCAAMNAVIMMFEQGDHFICCDDVYGGTARLFNKVFSRTGFTFDFIDMTKLSEFDRVKTDKTKLIWIETPTNPLMKVIDIEAVSNWAKANKILVLVDSTFCSPAIQKPLNWGADLVLHSTTKYLGGHSDVVGGFVATRDQKLFEALKFNQNSIGSVPGPMDCFLTLRSTKTLAIRMERHSQNAMKVAEFLEAHPQVEKVLYPGLESHPQHAIAKKQMSLPGGMISFVIKGGLQASTRVLERCQIFSLAESLGGVESLIELPSIMTHASIPPATRKKLGIEDGLIRLSVGIEHSEDLIEDLKQALDFSL